MNLYDMAIDYAQTLGDVIHFCSSPSAPGKSYLRFVARDPVKGDSDVTIEGILHLPITHHGKFYTCLEGLDNRH